MLYFPGGGRVGKIKINNHLSPVDTEAGTELGNTPTGASKNPKDLDLNKNLHLIKIEIEVWNWNLKLKFEIEIWYLEFEI